MPLTQEQFHATVTTRRQVLFTECISRKVELADVLFLHVLGPDTVRPEHFIVIVIFALFLFRRHSPFYVMYFDVLCSFIYNRG